MAAPGILRAVNFRLQGLTRVYPVTKDTELLALRVDVPLPFAPDGSWVYVFVYHRRVGHWQWALDEAGIESVIEAYRTATAPDYVPSDWVAPDGEPPMIRPPIRDLLARAMERARPGPPLRRPPCQIVSKREEP